MSIKRNALGKGLSALLENSETDITSGPIGDGSAPVSGAVPTIPVSQVEPNPFQPRTDFDEAALQELAASIKVHGIIQPITVRKLGYDRYQLIAGERRLKASKLAGLKNIPAFVRIANDQNMLEMALVENIQRDELNDIEVAISYKRLIDECSLTQEELSERVGKNRSTVTNTLRLLRLPPEIQAAIRDGKITMGHARAILGVDDIVKQLMMFRDIINGNLNVRDTEALARVSGNKSASRRAPSSIKNTRSFELDKIQQVLSSHFGTKISLKKTGSGNGKIIIPFKNDEDLNRVLELLNY